MLSTCETNYERMINELERKYGTNKPCRYSQLRAVDGGSEKLWGNYDFTTGFPRKKCGDKEPII